MSAPVHIIGAGVMGLCVATELTTRGVAVTLQDTAPQPGPQACSWWAGGMLAPFCEGESAEEPVVRLGQEAADWWAGQGVPVQRNGSLVIALDRDRREIDRFARRTHAHELLTADQIATLEPQLAGRFQRALHFASEAHLAPRQALGILSEALRAKGITVQPDAPKTKTRTIDCRGLSAKDALPDLRGVKGEMVVLHAPEVTLHRPIRLLHPRHPLYVVPRGDGVFMLGATQIESGERGRPSVRSILELLSAAYALHPAFGEAELVEIGTDARPAFPDNMPRLRQRGDTLYINGLFRHGFLLAPAMARMAADLICDGTRPERMDEDTTERC